MRQKVWVITREINAYEQEGEYFEAVFMKKPTVEQLVDHFYKSSPGSKLEFGDPLGALQFVLHVQSGGGRRGTEHEWFNLREVEAI